MEKYYTQVNELRELERGTLGKEIANCLDGHRLTLVPNFESHDLKHVLLDYKMTAEDEIRMQAFMIGNGNYSIPSFTIFLFGAILLPDMWRKFYEDFNNGRNTIPIAEWTINEYANCSITQLRDELSKPRKQTFKLIDMKKIMQYASVLLIFIGAFGMLFCLPYLFSSNLADLIGAGFPFVAGAILVAGGVLSLSNVAKNKINNQTTSFLLNKSN